MQSSSHHVLTLDGEVVAVNGKLLAGHGNIRGLVDEDQTSVVLNIWFFHTKNSITIIICIIGMLLQLSRKQTLYCSRVADDEQQRYDSLRRKGGTAAETEIIFGIIVESGKKSIDLKYFISKYHVYL